MFFLAIFCSITSPIAAGHSCCHAEKSELQHNLPYAEEQRCRAACKLKYPLSETQQRECEIAECNFSEQPNNVNVNA